MRRATPVILAATLLLVGCATPPPVERTRPNVILISIDSLRADHVGAYGYAKPTTPALDTFIASGAMFADSYATSPWTLPSHASMFTGLYPDAHMASRNDSRMDDAVHTAAEAFLAAGYDTQGIVCAPFLRQAYNIHQGFNGYDEEIARTKRPNIRQIKTSESINKKALRYLKKRAANPQPFFLFLHYWDVHYDYNPPAKYVALFDPDYDGDIDGANISKRKDLIPGMDERDLEHIIALYDGEIRYTDDYLGKLLAYLDESGLARDTAVIITSDHGEEFLEHGSTGHTFTCFEELIRVPLAMRIPGVTRAGQVLDTRVENVDLYPTMLAIAGLKFKGGIHGHNLLPLIREGKAPPRETYYCETRMGRRWGWRTPNGIWRSLLFADGRKVHYYKRAKMKKPEINLYNVGDDPGEKIDLAAGEGGADRVLPLRRELTQVHRANRALGRKFGFSSASWKRKKKPGRENDGLEDQLKGLGYVQ